MARKKEYDKDQVLDLATELFWEKGYNATSINDIVKTTGLNKHSMYEVFGSKDGLFKEVLFTYANKKLKSIYDILEKEPVGIKNIELYLSNRIENALKKDSKGCLVANSFVEKNSLNDEIIKIIQNNKIAVEEKLLDCLNKVQKNGEISKDKDTKVLSKYIMTFSNGLSVDGKDDLKRDDYMQMLDFFVNSLKS